MGYQMRMTLAFGMLAFLSVTVFTLLFLFSSYQEFKTDRMVSVERMTSCLAGNIYNDIQAGDNQRLSEALNRFSRGISAPSPPSVIVLTANQQVFTSNDIVTESSSDTQLELPASNFGTLIQKLDNSQHNSVLLEENHSFLSAARITRDGNDLGTVLVDYPLASLREHFTTLFQASILYSLALLLVLLVIGWLLGKQLVRPITQLRECMDRVRKGDLDIHCNAVQSRDEIGQLAMGFEEMLKALREKQLLEQKILQSERLAAVGQVAAGVAHEINNPLGGMLNAINTFKHHGQDEKVADRTLDLLERGLRQIQNTVQALLVQSRVEELPLSVADIDDIRTLIKVEVRNKSITLDWLCLLNEKIALPSTAVRHILINLLLNAIKAVSFGGHVSLFCEPQPGYLLLRIEDDGPGFPVDRKEKLFEPFFSSTGGHGLGLWFTYQTVNQLDGSIEVKDSSQGTVVEVRLPLAKQMLSTQQTIKQNLEVEL
ncbi:MAG: sensor histidine kinase [Gammaproteobacteria bacterium]